MAARDFVRVRESESRRKHKTYGNTNHMMMWPNDMLGFLSERRHNTHGRGKIRPLLSILFVLILLCLSQSVFTELGVAILRIRSCSCFSQLSNIPRLFFSLVSSLRKSDGRMKFVEWTF